MELSPESLQRIEKLIPRYPTKRSAVLPLLHIIQEEIGYISKTSMEWVAKKLDLNPMQVYEVVTFYPMLKEEPVGRGQVKVCRTLSCALRGGYKVCETLQKELACPLNGKSEDGAFSIEFVECLASCGTAPVVMVDDVLHEEVTPDKAGDFAKELKSSSKQKA